MTREGHRNNQIVIPDLSSTLFCVTFFPHPDGNLLLKCGLPQFRHAGPLHSLVIFRARRFDGGKLEEGPVVRRAFLFSNHPSTRRKINSRSLPP
jgi:hypothetical protein